MSAGVRRWLGPLAAVAFVGTAGCGGDGPYPVQGRVVFKESGQPLTGGWVSLEPTDPAVTVGSLGDIGRDGRFRLSTYKRFDGAKVGTYKVMVKPPVPANPDRPPPPLFDPRYESLASTPLELTVTRGGNDFTIEVEKPPTARGP